MFSTIKIALVFIMLFNIQGNRIGNFEFITNKCTESSTTSWRNIIYSMTKRGNDKFVCVLRCYVSNYFPNYDFYGIGFIEDDDEDDDNVDINV